LIGSQSKTPPRPARTQAADADPKSQRPARPGQAAGSDPKSPHPAVRPAQTADVDPKSRRRSSRLTIDVPIEIISKGSQNKIQIDETRTYVVSAHGCGFTLKSGLQPGDSIVLIHKLSREEISCRVVMCRQVQKTGEWEAGVEFQVPSPKFWHIAFPPDDWDPSSRKVGATPEAKK
jgi:hypothetical protein